MVIFSPRPSSQSSTRPLNWLKRSFINSRAWPTAVRMRSLTEHDEKEDNKITISQRNPPFSSYEKQPLSTEPKLNIQGFNNQLV